MTNEQTIIVTTHPDRPHFQVSAQVSDDFISERVESLYGFQQDGQGHCWLALEVEAAREVQ